MVASFLKTGEKRSSLSVVLNDFPLMKSAKVSASSPTNEEGLGEGSKHIKKEED